MEQNWGIRSIFYFHFIFSFLLYRILVTCFWTTNQFLKKKKRGIKIKNLFDTYEWYLVIHRPARRKEERNFLALHFDID
jgi:hypothetical protein